MSTPCREILRHDLTPSTRWAWSGLLTAYPISGLSKVFSLSLSSKFMVEWFAVWIIEVLKLSRWQNWIKYSQADSRVEVWKFRPVAGEARIPSPARIEWRSSQHRSEHLFTSLGVVKPSVALWRGGGGQSKKRWRTFAPWFGCVPKRILLNFG